MLCSCGDARAEQLKAAEKQSALPPVEMGVTAFPAPPLKQVEALPAEAGQLWAAAEGANASMRGSAPCLCSSDLQFLQFDSIQNEQLIATFSKSCLAPVSTQAAYVPNPMSTHSAAN